MHCALQWRHNGRDSVSNHQPHDCLLNRVLRRRSKKTSKLRVTGLCAGNSPGTGEFPAEMASYAENVSIWWRQHGSSIPCQCVHHHTSRHYKQVVSDVWQGYLDNLRNSGHLESHQGHYIHKNHRECNELSLYIVAIFQQTIPYSPHHRDTFLTLCGGNSPVIND